MKKTKWKGKPCEAAKPLLTKREMRKPPKIYISELESINIIIFSTTVPSKAKYTEATKWKCLIWIDSKKTIHTMRNVACFGLNCLDTVTSAKETKIDKVGNRVVHQKTYDIRWKMWKEVTVLGGVFTRFIGVTPSLFDENTTTKRATNCLYPKLAWLLIYSLFKMLSSSQRSKHPISGSHECGRR